MQRLNLTRDIQGYPATSLNLRPMAPIKFSATLAITTEKTFTVPESYQNWALFLSVSFINDIWVAVNATATIPASGSFASTNSVRNPPGLLVQGGDVIHIISNSSTVDVGIELFPLN